MLNDPEKVAEEEPIQVRCYFVRERNALLVRAQFTDLYTDYYLHNMQHEIRYEPEMDQTLKDALAVMALHLASKPRQEAHAWTLSWQEPAMNLFVTGSNRLGNITGRIFTEDIRKRDQNLLVAQSLAEGHEARQSMVEPLEQNFFRTGELFYEQSEQRLARFYHIDEEDIVFISAQPDCDEEWLANLTDEDVKTLDQKETLSLLETREYIFHCGCSAEKVFPVVASMSDEGIEELFAGREVAVASCPRCGAQYTLSREALEGFRQQ